jgi:hypothetical protein
LRTWESRENVYKIVAGNLQERGNLGDISTDVRRILKQTCNR